MGVDGMNSADIFDEYFDDKKKSEIEKMYENANVEDKNINNQLYKDLNYPQFTAEKQLELIKWLGEKNYTVRIDFHENEWGIATEDFSGYFQDNLSDALASIINSLWQDLTEQEQEQIRSILNE